MRWMILFLLPSAGLADSLVATRVIAARTVLTAEDVTLVDAEIPGALIEVAAAVGQETRVTLYPGRPVRAVDIAASALIERNQIITLTYLSGALMIVTEGRALDRGAEGERIEVMNLGSRTKVTGRVGPDGTVYVSPES